MLMSIAVILIFGFLLGKFCKLIHFPSLFGMIIAGIIIGPYALNLIDPSILTISSDIRRIALIIILIRAGLKLNLSDLKKVITETVNTVCPHESPNASGTPPIAA